jgi:Autotransporter beta-domain
MSLMLPSLRALPSSMLMLISFGAAAAELPAQPGHRPWLKTAGSRARTLDDPADASLEAADAERDRPRDRLRDGFFARLSLGTGWFTAFAGDSADRRTFSGVPVALEAYFGGTPLPWLGIGGGYSRDDVLALDSEDEVIDADEPDLHSISFHLETVGVFATFYPAPASPFYGFAAIGVARLDVRASDDDFDLPLLGMLQNTGDSDPSGYALSLGGGYDWWLNERWTAGISGRLLGARLWTDESGTSAGVTVLIPSALLTFGYH